MERRRFCFFCIFRDLFERRAVGGAFAVLTALAVGSVGYARAPFGLVGVLVGLVAPLGATAQLGSLARTPLGGMLMGWASMIALGCTVGVLLSGTMAGSAPGRVFLAACLVGSWGR